MMRSMMRWRSEGPHCHTTDSAIFPSCTITFTPCESSGKFSTIYRGQREVRQEVRRYQLWKASHALVCCPISAATSLTRIGMQNDLDFGSHSVSEFQGEAEGLLWLHSSKTTPCICAALHGHPRIPGRRQLWGSQLGDPCPLPSKLRPCPATRAHGIFKQYR